MICFVIKISNSLDQQKNPSNTVENITQPYPKK